MFARFSVRKPFTVFVGVIIVIVFGVIAFTRMTPDLLPNINTPYVMVMTADPGATAEEVETDVTDPLEKQMATLTNIENVTSVSSDNYSMVQMEFSDSVDMDTVSGDIRDKIGQIEDLLPDDIGTPVIMKVSMDMVPVVMAAVGMEGKSVGEVSEFTEENLEAPLESIDGVASVSITGMTEDNIQIILSQDKIDAINEKVADAIRSQFGEAESEINSGINSASGGKSQIDSAKNALSDADKEAAEQTATARAQLNESKDQLEELKENGTTLKELLDQYDSAAQAGNTQMTAVIEQTISEMGYSVDTLRAAVSQLDSIDDQIDAVNDAIRQLDAQSAEATFTLGSQYSELTASESTIDATVAQLQSSLEEVQSSEDAALASADMTGVLTMSNITTILNAQNFSMPAGYVTDGQAEVLVSVGDKIKNKDELESLVLVDMGIDGVDPITVADIGTVTYADTADDTYAKINGQNGVLLSFTKQSNYPTAEVSENIQDEFDALQKDYDELEFTMMMDEGEYIDIIINSVLENLLLGAVFAIIILFFFLRDIRPTIITAVSIPISVVFAIVLMYFSGVTLNLMSMAGLAIGVGMLVDNSIVVIENTYRLRALGYSRVQAAVSGASQVAGAITASTLTTICVFVPMLFVEGMTRDLFMDLALTIAYALIASLIIALTLVPAMSRGMLRKETKKTVLSQDGVVIRNYRKAAAWGLGHKAIVIIVSIALLGGSAALALSNGFTYMPSMASTQITGTLQMPEDSTLKETAKATDEMAEELMKIDGVDTVGAMLSSDTMGALGISVGNQDVTSTGIYVVLEEDKLDNNKRIADKMKEMAEENGYEVSVSADMDMSSFIGGSGITINLYCDDLDVLRETGVKLENALRDMKEIDEVSDVNEESTEEIKVVVNKNLAMKEGLTTAQVYQQVAEKLASEATATTLSNAGNTVDVVIDNSANTKITKDDLNNMQLTAENQDGTTSKVQLSSIATLKDDASLDTINHDNQKRSLQVTASIKDDYNVTLVTSDVKDRIEEQKLIPAGVTMVFSGENEEIMDALQQMMLLVVVGLILVYLIMVAQFQSLRSPLIVIFTIPLAFTGGLLALLICRQEVSVISMMGFVMLMGIIVNNAIVLVDCINRFRSDGMEMDEAIINAGAVRMRPVIMTAVTTVLGLLPLAIGFGTGAEMIQPVAIVCIGGLIYATLMTLLVVPVMYKIFARKHMEKVKEEELEVIDV